MLSSMEEKRVDHKPIYNVAKTPVESQTVLRKTVDLSRYNMFLLL